MTSGRRQRDNQKNTRRIDLKLLERKASAKRESQQPPAAWRFEDTVLHPTLKRNLAHRGYTYPTPIQEQTLYPAMEGRDILGIARTGTGKTAAFLIPVIEQLMKDPAAIRTLIVVPTRELALQVTGEFESIAAGLGLYSHCFIGGTSVETDIRKLKKESHVVVGTPGRLIDLFNKGALRLESFSTLILDEFDRMLDMGFVQDVRKLLKGLTMRKQTMFFSATMDKDQRQLIDSILTHPVQVRVDSGAAPTDQVEQELIRVQSGNNKFDVLLNLINNSEFKKVLIFAETKRQVNQVGKKLNQKGIRSDIIHGNKSQNYRVKALKQFSEGNLQVLVATDIAARGLDVSDVSHVINYQLPRTMDSYIHRIGRTGRAGRSGRAFTFVD